jgi:hypothetical protein
MLGIPMATTGRVMAAVGGGRPSGTDRRARFRLGRCRGLFVVGSVALGVGTSSARSRAVAATGDIRGVLAAEEKSDRVHAAEVTDNAKE